MPLTSVLIQVCCCVTQIQSLCPPPLSAMCGAPEEQPLQAAAEVSTGWGEPALRGPGLLHGAGGDGRGVEHTADSRPGAALHVEQRGLWRCESAFVLHVLPDVTLEQGAASKIQSHLVVNGHLVVHWDALVISLCCNLILRSLEQTILEEYDKSMQYEEQCVIAMAEGLDADSHVICPLCHRPTMQPTQSYSVGGQRSSGQLTGKPAGARPDLRGRWCANKNITVEYLQSLLESRVTDHNCQCCQNPVFSVANGIERCANLLMSCTVRLRSSNHVYTPLL
ncbi:UNVERIFIED_CONTAM: hypothetical protein FKN15_037817 [Acipenser sinensis]